jgi:hypothetical protein
VGDVPGAERFEALEEVELSFERLHLDEGACEGERRDGV